MAKIEVSNILSTVVPVGITPSEHYKNLYEEIGNFFIENAEILASDLTDLTGSQEYKIVLDVNELVSIEKTINYLVEGKK
ncbi:hypothetical protein MPH47_19470 [Psychrobacillus psychrodurans]|uniref:hypothetical protein n=1 Tax=Psychrobacillus psychrodurans TaxID=126157 RepID=UPI001F4DCE1C|nr:hypothetical protein [Psychrobacillus psychrodurans]MCK1999377.1 hypothetical protein [Psychrobacillus psychrodurans]